MIEPICEHGSQRRKCPICEYNDILDDVTKVIKLLNGIDEKECSITVWNTVVDVIDILEEA